MKVKLLVDLSDKVHPTFKKDTIGESNMKSFPGWRIDISHWAFVNVTIDGKTFPINKNQVEVIE